MKEEILRNLDNPRQLEKLYRSGKMSFKNAFGSLYPGLSGNALADGWHERLHFENEDILWGNRNELVFVVLVSLAAGFLAKIPAIFGVGEAFFYSRNVGFIVLPLLTGYFAWRNQLSLKKLLPIFLVILISVAYINLLPNNNDSSTLQLACLHLPLMLWVLLGIAFAGGKTGDLNKRLNYLSYNGDLLVMTGLIAIAGGLLTAITIGLFSLIGFNIEQFYFEYIVIFGVSAAPFVATHLTLTNPQLVRKVSPVIATIFSPLVLVMLLTYLVAILYSGKDPYNDREFLLLFNALLIGVMALIFFSVAETHRTSPRRAETWILFLLSLVTIIVNGVALSAIVFRISTWGITPNRLAVLGSNLLMLVNLILVGIQLLKVLRNKGEVTGVGKIIALYLPVYFIWTIIVTFLFPLLFEFK